MEKYLINPASTLETVPNLARYHTEQCGKIKRYCMRSINTDAFFNAQQIWWALMIIQKFFTINLVERLHHGLRTYLGKVADTDGSNSVVFYSNPFMLVCEFKCCKTTQQTQNTKSFPLDTYFVILGQNDNQENPDRHEAAWELSALISKLANVNL